MMPTVNLCSDCAFGSIPTPDGELNRHTTRWRYGPCGRYPGQSRTEARARCRGELWARQTPCTPVAVMVP